MKFFTDTLDSQRMNPNDIVVLLTFNVQPIYNVVPPAGLIFYDTFTLLWHSWFLVMYTNNIGGPLISCSATARLTFLFQQLLDW